MRPQGDIARLTLGCVWVGFQIGEPLLATLPLMTSTAVLGLLVLAVLWGSAFPMIKVGLEGLSAPHLALARHLVASIAFVPFLLLTDCRLYPKRDDLSTFFLLGFLGITVYHLSLNYGELWVSAGATSLIIATAPAVTAVLAYFLASERLPGLGWFGSAMSFAGVALIVVGDDDALRFNPYAGLVMLSSVVTAFYFVLQRPLFARYRAVEVTAFSTWAGTLPLLLFLPGFGRDVADAGILALAASAYIGVFPSAVAYSILAYALSRASASLVTAYLYAVPVFSLLFSWIILAETPTWLTLVGGVVVIGGIVIVNWAKRREVGRVAALGSDS